jgi:hypothetical protein
VNRYNIGIALHSEAVGDTRTPMLQHRSTLMAAELLQTIVPRWHKPMRKEPSPLLIGVEETPHNNDEVPKDEHHRDSQ